MAADDKSKKKIKSFKNFDPKKYVDVTPTLDEPNARGKTNEALMRNVAVIAFGRMNPMTVGHEKLIAKVISEAAKRKAEPMVFLSHSAGAKSKTGKGSENKDPIVYDEKIKFAIKAFGPIVKKSPFKTLFDIIKSLNGKYKNVVMVAGSDRVDEYTALLQKYNGKEYSFESIQVVSAGARDPDSEGVSGMSGSKMREYAKNNDSRNFAKGLPKNLQSSADEVMAAVQKGMNMTEETDLDEALNRMQRMKRGRAMKKARFKIKRGRDRAARKTASMDVLKKRARKAAIAVLKKKFTKGRNYNDLSPGEKEIIDKRVEKISAKRIEAIARKLLPKVRQTARDRLSSNSASKNENLDINTAFENFITEASCADTKVRQRPHMLMDKNNKTKFDGRFKIFKKKPVNEGLEDLAEDLEILALDTENYIDTLDEGGLWANIHAKRKRIKNGSGEKMKKPGSKGAPTDQDFKDSQESVSEATFRVDINGLPSMFVDAESAPQVKKTLRQMLKKPDDLIKDIARVQPAEVKKHFRLKALGKEEEIDEEVELDEMFSNVHPMLKKELGSHGVHAIGMAETDKGVAVSFDRSKNISDLKKQMDQHGYKSVTQSSGSTGHNHVYHFNEAKIPHALDPNKSLKHARTDRMIDKDNDGDVDKFDKQNIPDEITGAEKINQTPKMMKKYADEIKHTKKGVAYESNLDEVGGAGDWGTRKLVQKFRKDTPKP